MNPMPCVITDGGRKAAGFTEPARGGCVARSITIVSGRPYGEVHATLTAGKRKERKLDGRRMMRGGKMVSADHGIDTSRSWFQNYMRRLGFVWVPLAKYRVYLREDELPMGRLIVETRRHYCAVIDGVIHDTFNPGASGRRPVRGYWKIRD